MSEDKMRRGFGEGTIEPNGRGHRVRMRIEGKRRDLGTYATVAEAESIRAGFLAAQCQGMAPTGALTLRAWGARWLDDRERAGGRAIASDRSRWMKHIATAPFADWPLKSIERRDVKAWLKKLAATLPGWQSRKHCLNLLRRALHDALDDEILERNVADGIEFARPADLEDVWTFLMPDEQRRLAACAPEDESARKRFLRECERLIALVALGTGMRQGEQWNLELRDVHVDDEEPWLFVRWGSKGKAPKNGKTRRVPLFGLGLEAMRAWLEVLPRYIAAKRKNQHGLAFPTERGYRRQKSKQPRTWPALLKAAKLDVAERRHDGRALRWHDLRHSCASSLVAGWWGRKWTLDEVREVLGHSSVTVTERYAHLAPGVIAAAASATTGPNLALVSNAAALENSSKQAARHAGVEPATFGSGGRSVLRLVSDTCADLRAEVRTKSERYIQAVASRNRFAHRHGIDLAETALELVDALETGAARSEGPTARGRSAS